MGKRSENAEGIKINITLPVETHRTLKHWAIDHDDVPLATAAARVIEYYFIDRAMAIAATPAHVTPRPLAGARRPAAAKKEAKNG